MLPKGKSATRKQLILQIAQALVARGHEVHAYMNDNCEVTRKMAALGVTVHSYSHTCFGDDDAATNQRINMMMWDPSFFQLISAFSSLGERIVSETHAMLGAQTAISALKNVGFDLCVVDGIFLAVHFHILPYKLDIPTVPVLAVFQPLVAGVPGLPSFTPYINFGKFTNEMTFVERVQNVLLTTVFDAIVTYTNPAGADDLVAKYVPEKPFVTLATLQRRSRLWLVLSDVTIDYPQVRMPHVVDVGGINTRPGRPLPAPLRAVADGASHGLIVVSFGTYVTQFPEQVRSKFLEAFGQLKQTVVMKLTKGADDEKVPQNVHLFDWLPQNDLLAHSNTVLFITHCGMNGQFEALYHAVPMLGFPIFGDQLYNALRITKKGLGLYLPIMMSTPHQVVAAVNEILTNRSFSEAMALHSAMFKDRPQTPTERLVYSLERIIKYGPDRLYNPAVNLPWYSYWCVDVAAFLLSILVVVMLLVMLVFRLIYRCLCKRRQQKTKTQ